MIPVHSPALEDRHNSTPLTFGKVGRPLCVFRHLPSISAHRFSMASFTFIGGSVMLPPTVSRAKPLVKSPCKDEGLTPETFGQIFKTVLFYALHEYAHHGL